MRILPYADIPRTLRTFGKGRSPQRRGSPKPLPRLAWHASCCMWGGATSGQEQGLRERSRRQARPFFVSVSWRPVPCGAAWCQSHF